MDGREWELGIIACLLRNSQYIRNYSEILLEKHFADPLTPKYIKILKACYKKHMRLPTHPEFRHLVQAVANKENQTTEMVRKMLHDAKEIYMMEVSDITREHLEQFIFERVMLEIREKIPDADPAKRMEFITEVRTRMDGIARMGGSYESKGTFILDPEVIRATFQEIQNVDMSGYRTTGFKRLDSLIGGYGPGEFSVFAGATGKGKTALMVASGAANIEAGYRVLHISLDEPEWAIKKRYLQNFTGIPKKALVSEEQYLQAVERLANYQYNMVLWSEPNETITTLDIEAFIERKQEELYYIDINKGLRPPETAGKIELIIVDYATKTRAWMSRTKSSDQSWDRIRYCSEEHQNLARKLNIPVLSAFQGAKDMAQNEIGQLTSIAMGYSGNQALTNFLIIGQLQEDLHMDPMPLWIYGAKTRCEEGLFLVPILYDKSRQRCWDDETRDIDYISSTISKKAKPMNYSSDKAKAERKRDTPPKDLNENPDYQSEDAETRTWKTAEEARDSWKQKQRGMAMAMED